MSVDGPPRRHAALAVASRAHLLDVLRSDERPRTVQELAAAGGLHVNTVRFHLEVLEEAGLVEHRSGPTGGRGRPRHVYSAVAEPAALGYEFLAGMLAEHWTGTPEERSRRAEQAGFDQAAGREGAPRSQTVAEAVDEVAALFDEMGFEPDVVHSGEDAEIRLRHCPFRSVAAAHPEIVCSMHLGIIRRVLSDVGAPDVPARLEPFVEPRLCIAHVGPAPAARPAP